MLKAQDLLVLLKLVALGRDERQGELPARPRWRYASLAAELSMSPSEVHAAVRRLLAAGLVSQVLGREGRASKVAPLLPRLEDFALHGLRHVFYAQRGEEVRGMPTRHAAAPLAGRISVPGPPPVWPDPQGETRGQAFMPLYAAAPRAARRDETLYRLLVLVDALRGGRTRERTLAAALFQEELARYRQSAP